jgi:hypothetical protein
MSAEARLVLSAANCRSWFVPSAKWRRRANHDLISDVGVRDGTRRRQETLWTARIAQRVAISDVRLEDRAAVEALTELFVATAHHITPP